jgi:hypothetical protein
MTRKPASLVTDNALAFANGIPSGRLVGDSDKGPAQCGCEKRHDIQHYRLPAANAYAPYSYQLPILEEKQAPLCYVVSHEVVDIRSF